MGLGHNRNISIIVIYDLSTIVKLFLKYMCSFHTVGMVVMYTVSCTVSTS